MRSDALFGIPLQPWPGEAGRLRSPQLFSCLACLRTAGETSDGQVVDLNIVATDRRGQPVTDLASREIRITDNSKPQWLLFFQPIDRRLPPPAKLQSGEFSNRTAATIPHATVVLLDFLNERFTTRAIASNRLVHYLESLEAADYLYLYFLTMDGRILPVRGLNGEQAEMKGPGATAGSDGRQTQPWTRDAKALIEAATRQALQVRPSNLDVGTPVELTYGALNTLGGALSRVTGTEEYCLDYRRRPAGTGPGPFGNGPDDRHRAHGAPAQPCLRALSDSDLSGAADHDRQPQRAFRHTGFRRRPFYRRGARQQADAGPVCRGYGWTAGPGQGHWRRSGGRR